MQVKTGRGEIASHMCPVSCEQIYLFNMCPGWTKAAKVVWRSGARCTCSAAISIILIMVNPRLCQGTLKV